MAEGLVEQHHLRVQGERPGDRHPLLLSAGELVRVAARLVAQPDQVEHLTHPAGLPLRRALPQTEAEFREVKGVGELKLKKYGQAFLDCLKKNKSL